MSSATRKQKRTEVNMMLASIFTSVRFCFHWHSAKHATDSEQSEGEVRTAESVSEGGGAHSSERSEGGGAHSGARGRCTQFRA